MSREIHGNAGKVRFSKALAVGGWLFSGTAVTSYILSGACALGFWAAIGLLKLGTGLLVALSLAHAAVLLLSLAVGLSFAQPASLAMHIVALGWSRNKRLNFSRKWRGFTHAGIILAMLLLAAAIVITTVRNDRQNAWHHKLDSDYIVRTAIALNGSDYAEPARGTPFPPSLASAAILRSESELFEETIRVPDGRNHSPVIPYGATEADWPKYAAAVDEESDYRYVGADLVHSPALRLVAHRIVLLYNKAPYDGGRTVAFADGTQRFVKNAELPAVFADASAARATLGLPAITLDGAAPKAR